MEHGLVVVCLHTILCACLLRAAVVPTPPSPQPSITPPSLLVKRRCTASQLLGIDRAKE